jgi:hypothetical protein
MRVGACCKCLLKRYKFISKHLPVPSVLLIYICSSRQVSVINKYPHRCLAAERYAQFIKRQPMKRILTILTVILISCGQQKYEHKNLTEIASELNALCPKMVDSVTRWDKVSMSGNCLELTFTLVNLDKDSTDIEGLTKEVKAFLIKNLEKGFNMNKTQIDLNYIKQNNVVFHYIYLDKRKQVLSDIIIKPEEYGNLPDSSINK